MPKLQENFKVISRIDVEYINHSIGINFGDVIQLNKNLKKYPYLHNKVLKHEVEHTSNPRFTWYDFKHDYLTFDIRFGFLLILFCLWHPLALLQYFPLRYRKKTIFYDANLIVLYCGGIIFIFIARLLI